MLNRRDRKRRRELVKEAREINKYRETLGFFRSSFDLHYSLLMELIKELDIKNIRDDLSKDNPLYKSSR